MHPTGPSGLPYRRIAYVFNTFYQRTPEQVFSLVSDPTDEEKALGSAMSTSWTDFVKNPHTGWAYPPLQSGATGPYVQWVTPIEELSNLGEVVHSDLWASIEPTVAYQ